MAFTNISRYARLFSSSFAMPFLARRLPQVPVDSSAARIPTHSWLGERLSELAPVLAGMADDESCPSQDMSRTAVYALPSQAHFVSYSHNHALSQPCAASHTGNSASPPKSL